MERKRLIKLTPKTHKGKNRVKENGDMWEVVREGIILNHVMVDIPGDNDMMLIRSTTNPAIMRWMNLENDRDFDWSEIYER